MLWLGSWKSQNLKKPQHEKAIPSTPQNPFTKSAKFQKNLSSSYGKRRVPEASEFQAEGMEEDIGRANTVEVQDVVDKGISVENKHKSKIRSCSTDTF